MVPVKGTSIQPSPGAATQIPAAGTLARNTIITMNAHLFMTDTSLALFRLPGHHIL
jgi:hypothetical protein